MPAELPVSSSTTPRFATMDSAEGAVALAATASGHANAARSGTEIAPAAMVLQNITVTILFDFQAFQHDFGLPHAKVAGTPIPGHSHAPIAARTAQMRSVEKDGVESLP